jgi:serine/threonine protein phosphatase 1
MFAKLFGASRTQAAHPVGSIPDGQRVYAVGDIHGRADLLDTILATMEADDRSRAPAETMLIFLGDLVDRGPESARVVETLMQLKASRPTTRFLLGNHEEVFLLALQGDLAALKFFVRIGGKPTILSYGIDEQSYEQADYEELLELLRERVPAAHIDFLSGFEDMIIVGDYAFVHAGVNPSKALQEQKPSDLRWIREPFLAHRRKHEKIIVHGHTIADDVEMLPHRIGLDTGAFASGRLSALALEGSQRWVLQT